MKLTYLIFIILTSCFSCTRNKEYTRIGNPSSLPLSNKQELKIREIFNNVNPSWGYKILKKETPKLISDDYKETVN